MRATTPKAPFLTFSVYENPDHYTVEWSAIGMHQGARMRADVPVDTLLRLVDSLKQEYAERRGRGRPPNGYWDKRRVLGKFVSRHPGAPPAPFVNPFGKKPKP